MKILLTGFNSFKGVRVNPSEQVVHELASRLRNAPGMELVTAVLPTEYNTATRQIRRLIRGIRPDAIVCLGVAPRREEISLERVALNLDDDSTPDNAGVIRRGRRIAPGEPDLYWSSLPLSRLHAKLRKVRIKAAISNHAGTFLCNHVFYIARREADRARRPIPCGFIHLPGTATAGHPRGGNRRRGSKKRNSLPQLVRAVVCCLKALQGEASRGRRRATGGC